MTGMLFDDKIDRIITVAVKEKIKKGICSP